MSGGGRGVLAIGVGLVLPLSLAALAVWGRGAASPGDGAGVGASLGSVAAALVSLAGALAAALMAGNVSRSLAAERRRDERRTFCLHLQQQFDSPEFFRCRYEAWKKLNRGDFAGVRTLSDLLHGEHWTPEVSAVFHFFESLNRYCEEELIDAELAGKLFGRSYDMWFRGVLARIEVDPAAEGYRPWLDGVRALGTRMSGGFSAAPLPAGAAGRPGGETAGSS